MKTGIERLNDCFRAFPEETKALLHHWIPCPPGMDDHVFHRDLPDGTKLVSVIGLLNATLLRDTGNRLGYITPPGEMSREEEIASVEGYDLVPESRFCANHTVPVPEDAVLP